MLCELKVFIPTVNLLILVQRAQSGGFNCVAYNYKNKCTLLYIPVN